MKAIVDTNDATNDDTIALCLECTVNLIDLFILFRNKKNADAKTSDLERKVLKIFVRIESKFSDTRKIAFCMYARHFYGTKNFC